MIARAVSPFLLLSALGCATAFSAHAQEPLPADSVPAYLLEGVRVEARRAAALRTDLPQQVDVVTRTDLERTHAADVADALKRTATVDVIQFPALLSGVSVRGFRPQFSGISQRTLILVDGRPAGATNLATLDLAAVERIEVLKGPASALYGSSAMGGAVNIVTRRSSGPLRGSLDTGYGSFGSYRGQFTTGGNVGERFQFDLGLSATGRTSGFETGGARFFGGEEVTKFLADGSTEQLPETVRDTLLDYSEFSSRSGNLRAAVALAPGWRAEGRLAAFRGNDIQNPGDVNVTAYSTRTLNDLQRTSGDLGLSGEVGAHSVTLRLFSSREVTSYYDDPDNPTFISSKSPNRWHGAQLQDVLHLGSHSVTAGIDYTSAEAASEVFSARETPVNPFSPDASIRSLAAFSEARLDVLGDGSLVGTVGGRVDRISFEIVDATLGDGSRVEGNVEQHSVFNPSGGVVWQPGGGVRVHASGGRSFVTPGAFNVAGYSELPSGENAVVVTRGNPTLDPESAISWDLGIGITRPQAGIEADLTYFRTDVRGRVAAVPVLFDDIRLTPGGDTIRAITSYANADDGEIHGIEAALSYDLGARLAYPFSLRLFSMATRILSARETTGGVTTDVRNVADLTLIGGVEFDDLERFSTRLSARYVGERLDTDFTDFMNPGDVRYPQFLVIDLTGSVRLGDRYRISAQVANLADEHYYEVRGYTMPGREFRVGLGVDW